MSFKKDSTAVLILEDGTIFHGQGFGAETKNIGELCFNTSMTGYQEIMTDPSYAGQIITFTFPHIGNTGTNAEDIETLSPAARGMVVREEITNPSSWRQDNHLDAWLKHHNLPGIAGIDTRALTKRIRDLGAPKAAIIYREDMKFDTDAILQEIKEWNGLNGLDLAIEVTTKESYNWDEALWELGAGYAKQTAPNKTIVAIDYGAKRNILRCLAATGAKVIVVPAQTSAEEILKHKPDGVFLSNGPGDPSATGQYAVPVIKELLEKDIPLFGICLGHQLLSLAVGAKTQKMHLGHRGANHPVKDVHTGKVEITSQNHGFEVITDTLPETAELTHFSLFDKTNEGMRLKNKKAFSVQYHPEASPGPQDSHYLFDRFITMIDEAA
ncbi:MAG: carbamoyl phosphate synthase small subunit [Micavibrio sp.]|nr:carbamoyl phosphate synthase small subunit [Micavibrio sp.]HCK33162.1 carbamoyl phosphate synthase small subunit [Rhodospirillaceae bacterium]|tara:strand:+ start:86 stop:1234 length:1149 start_codon:yes stop_codon:yes gene_type:complete